MLGIAQKDTVEVRQSIKFGTASKSHIGHYCKVLVAKLGQDTGFGALTVFRVMCKNKYHFGSRFIN